MNVAEDHNAYVRKLQAAQNDISEIQTSQFAKYLLSGVIYLSMLITYEKSSQRGQN